MDPLDPERERSPDEKLFAVRRDRKDRKDRQDRRDRQDKRPLEAQFAEMSVGKRPRASPTAPVVQESAGIGEKYLETHREKSVGRAVSLDDQRAPVEGAPEDLRVSRTICDERKTDACVMKDDDSNTEARRHSA